MNPPIEISMRSASLAMTFILVLVLLFGIWASSGTLAPYAAGSRRSVVTQPCHYLLNPDHPHFEGVVDFLHGKPEQKWKNNILLRRVLHPLLALPFINAFGFTLGGFFANLVIHAASFLAFLYFIFKRDGPRAAWFTGALVATYPGIAYWAGLPYSYAMIVPCYLLGFILLWKMFESVSLRAMLLYAVGLGVLSLGYDLVPFVCPAIFLMLLYRRRFLAAILCPAMVCVPVILFLAYLNLQFGVTLKNGNTEIYWVIFNSYLNPSSFTKWGELLLQLPQTLWFTFLYSNFLFLPLLFAFAIVLTIAHKRSAFVLHPVEMSLLLAILAVFIFNNAAPPYVFKWQLRGEWIARLYQPLFIVYLSFVGRAMVNGMLGTQSARILVGATVVTVLLNSITVFGPLLGTPWLAQHNYRNFYRHTTENTFTNNIALHGRRPLGFCADEPRPSAGDSAKSSGAAK